MKESVKIMPYPISVNKNNYNDNPKSSTVYTPQTLANYLFSLVLPTFQFETDRRLKVLDPAVGTGNLLRLFMCNSRIFETYGIDIVDKVPNSCEYFHKGKFEEWPNGIERFKPTNTKELGKEFIPDLIICNPPFNGCSGRQLYPEVFLRHIDKLFGHLIPTIMVVPMGFRLNQRKKSLRWKYLRDNWEISSIMTLPIDMFGDVLFHAEIIFFNFPFASLAPHYFYE